MDPKVDWFNVLWVFRNDPARLAFVPVTVFRCELSKDPLDLECIGWDTYIVSALALIVNIPCPHWC